MVPEAVQGMACVIFNLLYGHELLISDIKTVPTTMLLHVEIGLA